MQNDIICERIVKGLIGSSYIYGLTKPLYTMKHTRILFSLLLVAGAMTFAQAQVNKGAWMVGGSVAFESTEGENSIKIEPELGYFLINNLAVGSNFNIDFEGDDTQIEFGPFARYYAFKGLFAQAGIGYAKENDNDALIGYNGAVGYSWFLNNSVAFEPSLRYSSTDGIGTLYLGIGVQAFLGRN